MTSKIITVILCLVVTLALMLVQEAAPVKVALAQSYIGVNVTPQQTTVGLNENFSVVIWIDDSRAENYDGVAIRLVYNTNYVTATNVTDAGTFDWVLDSGTINNAWNASHGLIKYDAANIGGPLNTSNPVITVSFTGSSSNTGIAGLDFIYIPEDTATSVMSGGVDILNWTYVVNGTVEVVGPALMVDVSPAGKGEVNMNGVIPSAYPNTTRWKPGEVVNLTAVASAPNWTFDHWSGDISGSDNPTNITMDSGKSVVAHFAINRYNLTIFSTDGGNVTTPGEGASTYDAGTVVHLVAMADSGYHFVNWTGDVGTINDVDSATTNITMSGNYSITANFAATTLEGHVTFTERGSNNSKWAESFNVTLFEAGNLSNVLWTRSATTNNTGVFTIPGLTPGTYDIGIKNWTCLSKLVTNQILTADNTTVVDFGTTREGDANNDDRITILDASSLASIYGSSEGDLNWNPHCDFNRDGYIKS